MRQQKEERDRAYQELLREDSRKLLEFVKASKRKYELEKAEIARRFKKPRDDAAERPEPDAWR